MAAFFFAAILVVQEATAQSAFVDLRIEPQAIPVGLFYNGAQIHVSGRCRASDGLAIVCIGEENTVELKRKGKIWGLFWVNVGDIVFEHVPLLYQVVSSKKMQDLAEAADLVRAGVGIAALEAKIAPGMDEERRRDFRELVKLKENEGLYSIREGALEIGSRESDLQQFSVIFHFPAAVKPGKYSFHLVSFVRGRGAPLADGVISVQRVGTTAFIRSLSVEHGLVYGILSVLIALVAGLLTSFIFGRRSRKGVH